MNLHRDGIELPTLEQHLPPKALEAAIGVLVRELGVDRARALAHEMDTAAEHATRPPTALDREVEAQIAKNDKALKAALAKLAATTGLRWTKAYGRHHVVTLDGTLIGYVDPAGIRGDGKRTSVLGWRPSVSASTRTEPTTPCPTVEAAARAVHTAWLAEHRDRPSPAGAPTGPAIS